MSMTLIDGELSLLQFLEEGHRAGGKRELCHVIETGDDCKPLTAERVLKKEK